MIERPPDPAPIERPPLPDIAPGIAVNVAAFAGTLSLSNVFDWLWIVWLIAFPIIEGFALYADHKHPAGDPNRNQVDDDGFTLSAHTRAWYRMDTKLGRSAFLASMGGLAVWWLFHGLGVGIA